MKSLGCALFAITTTICLYANTEGDNKEIIRIIETINVNSEWRAVGIVSVKQDRSFVYSQYSDGERLVRSSPGKISLKSFTALSSFLLSGEGMRCGCPCFLYQVENGRQPIPAEIERLLDEVYKNLEKRSN